MAFSNDLISEFFSRIFSVDGDILIDISGSSRRSICGRDLPDYCDRVAASLANAGVKPGDLVVVILDNTIEAALTVLTAMRHGITLCVQPSGTSLVKIEDMKKKLGAKIIVNTANNELAKVKKIKLDRLLELNPISPVKVEPFTPFTITFTSGSTGVPKGVVHSAESFLTCAANFNRQTDITSEDCFLNVMPMFYMAGIFNGLIAPLVACASVVISDAFNASTALRFWQIVNGEAISSVWLSPTMLSLVSRMDRRTSKVPGCLKRLFIGTGALAASDAQDFHKIYGLAPLQSYGLSELLYVSVDDAQAPNFGTVGYVLDGVTLIAQSGEPLSILSNYAFLGYLVDGELHPHRGPFVTSDLSEMSETGILSILGRNDDIILRGGVNVNPVELEIALSPELAGRTYCIIGVPDKMLGQRVVLVVEGLEPDNNAFEKMQKIVRDEMERVQLDAKLCVNKIPTSPTGKLLRSELRSLLVGHKE